jgi:hypothetical protein
MTISAQNVIRDYTYNSSTFQLQIGFNPLTPLSKLMEKYKQTLLCMNEICVVAVAIVAALSFQSLQAGVGNGSKIGSAVT